MKTMRFARGLSCPSGARESAAVHGVLLVTVLMCAPVASDAQSLIWVHQFPGVSRGVGLDPDGHSVIANNTLNPVEDNRRESTVRKLDPLGNIVWEHLISEDSDVVISAIAADRDGRVAAAGEIEDGGADRDVFLRVYDSSGLELWTDTFGDSIANDEAHGVAFDADGNLYVGGQTSGTIGVPQGGQDGFLRKYDTSGNVVWTVQFGTSSADAVLGVATDSAGDILVTGRTGGALAEPLIGDASDGFVRKYSPTGEVVWTRQIGLEEATTIGLSVATAPDDSVVVGGRRFVSSTIENFVIKYGASGDDQWSVFIAPQPFDLDVAVAADGHGNAYLAGMTFLGEAFGPDIAGGQEEDSDDAYVQKRHAASGALEWSVRLSSQATDVPSSFDKSLAIATFGSANIYLSGETTGTFGGFGSGNGFLARLASGLTGADIQDDIDAIPENAFKAAGHSTAIQSILVEIDQAIADGDIAEAIRKLLNLRRRVDGCEDAPPADGNDWIIDCDVQDVVRALVDAMLAELSQ